MRYELIVTYDCNWNCCYCSVDTHNNSIDEWSVLYKIQKIQNGSVVVLSGGEIGLIGEGFMLSIIHLLKEKGCILEVNTNGLFMENFPHLMAHISKINYHCSCEMDEHSSVKIVDHPSVDYILIAHDDNIHKIEAFINRNLGVIFTVIPATTPATGIRGAPILSKKNSFIVLRRCGKMITNDSKRMLIFGKNYSNTVFI